MKFEKEIGEIYRLKVPFEDLYTSVFLIKAQNGNAIVDCATTGYDVDCYVTPALKEIGLSWSDVKYLIITHNHGDHAGGKARVLELAPNIVVVSDEREIGLDGITVYPLSGHTLDFVGVFDANSSTLISGDGLQGAGVGKYRCALSSKDAYEQTLTRIERDTRVANLLFSHAYEPWYAHSVFGREEVEACLEECRKYI